MGVAYSRKPEGTVDEQRTQEFSTPPEQHPQGQESSFAGAFFAPPQGVRPGVRRPQRAAHLRREVRYSRRRGEVPPGDRRVARSRADAPGRARRADRRRDACPLLAPRPVVLPQQRRHVLVGARQRPPVPQARPQALRPHQGRGLRAHRPADRAPGNGPPGPLTRQHQQARQPHQDGLQVGRKHGARAGRWGRRRWSIGTGSERGGDVCPSHGV